MSDELIETLDNATRDLKKSLVLTVVVFALFVASVILGGCEQARLRRELASARDSLRVARAELRGLAGAIHGWPSVRFRIVGTSDTTATVASTMSLYVPVAERDTIFWRQERP